jgi:catalase
LLCFATFPGKPGNSGELFNDSAFEPAKELTMPLPSDEKLIALSEDLLKVFDTIFSLHPGFRPVHAKGELLTGTFTPSKDAISLTRAPHIVRKSTPVVVRFSNATGIPQLPDNDPNANPHGMAIRFQIAERVHTDIIGHSTNGFPVRTGQEFLEFLRAVAASDPAKLSGSPLQSFLGSHPAALAFVQPRPVPASFATEAYFGLTAVRFTNQAGVSRYGRYQILPEAGIEYLDDATAKGKDANFLFEDLTRRLAAGPINFQIVAQLANEKDIVDNVTIQWPADRTMFDLGKLTLTGTIPNDAHEQKQIIFDPIPRVDGIEPSDDPLFELRAAIYLISGRRRRKVPE